MTIDDHILNTAKPIKPHPDDVAVDNFAAAMKEKLAIARGKGRSGWEECSPAELSAMLYEHVQKGDPRDVANFCMFLWNLGHSVEVVKPADADESMWCRYIACMIGEYLCEPVGSDKEKAIAGIIERRLWNLPRKEKAEQVALSAIQKRRIFDYIRGAYDLGYSDARDNKAVRGDGAPGYKGRNVEKDHGEALIHALNSTHPAPAVTQEPVLQRVMGRLADLLDEDQFAEIEGMVVRAGIAPPPTPTPSVAVNKTLLEAAKRAINYSQNVFKAEGVSFDDDEDLPFIVAAIKQAEPAPDLPPERIDGEAMP